MTATSFALAACGGDKGGSTEKEKPDESSLAPVRGGTVAYGIAAENADGWCLPEAQLAPPGIQEAMAVYETLTVPNAKGEIVPYLAKSITSNAEFTEWDIELRDGIKFHDGTDMDSTVVKNNIDAYRGTYPKRRPLLFRFVYDNIADVAVTGPLSLKVTTHKPWSSLPQVLWSTGRTGIMAQAQLDDESTCDSQLIGTGPFKLVEWKQNEKLVLERNEDYWRTDDDGNKLPYLDRLEFRPMPEGSSRTNALIAGEINAIQTGGAQQLETLEAAADDGKVSNTVSDAFPTVSFLQLNNAAAPFDNKNARLAAITALDLETFNQTINLGKLKIANGPFAPDNIGYLKDTGYPTFDIEASKRYAAAYKKETGKDLEFSLINPPDQATNSAMAMLQDMWKKAGIKVTLNQMEVAAMVSTAVSGKYEAMAFANYPGGDPDDNRVWWYGRSPVNLSRFDDPEINRLLDEGRGTDDRAKRQKIYGDINRRFGSEGYSIWLNWTLSIVSTAPDVHGVLGLKLPNGDDPFPALVNGHSVSGLWIEQ